MTPQFTTPCSVLITDKDKREEVCEALLDIGYQWNGYNPSMVEYIIVSDGVVYIQSFGVAIQMAQWNAGTNEALFLALAAMRSDTDERQWFLRIDTKEMAKCNTQHLSTSKLRQGFWRKATAAEIIEHFTQKGETK